MIIAKTLKGKGVSFIEDKNGWHGKPLNKEELARALAELGPIDKTPIGRMRRRRTSPPETRLTRRIRRPSYPPDKAVATRHAYGIALERIYPAVPAIWSCSTRR